MWQKEYQKYRDLGFTVVGLALDVEGPAPAKIYYEKYGVTFPALVDPNYATGFGAVPKTFFVDEHGVVQDLKNWQQQLNPTELLKPVTDEIRRQWTQPGQRLEASSIAGLVDRHRGNPADLPSAVELASRYLDLDLTAEAKAVLQQAVKHYQPREVALANKHDQPRLLGQAYLQLARASVGDRNAQIEYATLAFYLHPSVGFGKQIARIIAPEKFDGRPEGDFDNRFREGTLRRLQQERQIWLQGNGSD